VQYVEYLGRVVRGDFGTTISDKPPGHAGAHHLRHRGRSSWRVRPDRRLPHRHPARPDRRRTTRPGTDAALRVGAILAYATPVFFAGLLLKLVFAV